MENIITEGEIIELDKQEQDKVSGDTLKSNGIIVKHDSSIFDFGNDGTNGYLSNNATIVIRMLSHGHLQ